MAGKATIPYAAYLIRQNRRIETALSAKARKLPRYPAKGTPCVVIKSPSPNPAPWWHIVEHLAVGAQLPQLALPGAVVFVRTSGRLFALTFGHGHALLAPGAIEPDFGLRAVLQAVEPGQFRSIDVRSMESSPLVSKRQRHDGQAIHSFGIDRLHDLLKGITGKPQRALWKKVGRALVVGSDGAHGSAMGTDLEALIDVLDELFALFLKGYPEDFKWVEHLRLVRTDTEIDSCWKHLLKSPSSLASVGPPVPLEATLLDQLQPSWRQGSELTHALAQKRLAELGRLKDRKAARTQLSHDRIELRGEDGHLSRSWPLRDCVGAELHIKAQEYLLNDGNWFRLDAQYSEELATEFDRLVKESQPHPALSAWQGTDTEEKVYNDRIGQLDGWSVIDRKTRQYGRSRVELCDLLHASSGVLVHVKRGRDASSLSHLFAQGVVGTLTLLQDVGAREHLFKTAKLSTPQCKSLMTAIETRAIRIVFAIADGNPKANWRLPFFSMLAATQAEMRLREQRVFVDVVRIHDPNPPKRNKTGTRTDSWTVGGGRSNL